MAFLIPKGTMLHTFPAKYFSDFNPQATVFTEWSEKSVSEDCNLNYVFQIIQTL